MTEDSFAGLVGYAQVSTAMRRLAALLSEEAKILSSGIFVAI